MRLPHDPAYPRIVPGDGWQMTPAKETGQRVRHQIKLIASIALAALVVLSLSYLIQRATEAQIAGDFNQQQLHLAREAAIRIEDLFVGIVSSLELGVALAEDNPHPSTLSPHDIRALFESLQEKGPIDAVFLMGADGRIRRIHPPGAAERPSVRQALDRLGGASPEEGPRILLVPAGNGVTRRHVAAAVPLQSAKGREESALVGILDLEALLDEHINSIRSGQNGYAWLMDGRGTLLHHPRHPEMINRNVLRQDPTCGQCHGSFDLERQMSEGRVGLAHHVVARDRDVLLAYHPIRLGREPLAFLDLEFAAPFNDPAALPSLRTKARRVGEDLSQALGRRTSLDQPEVLDRSLKSALAVHPELKTIRVWSGTPSTTGPRLPLLGRSPPAPGHAAEPPPDLTAARGGDIVVAGAGTSGGPGARVILPLSLAVDLWSVAVVAPSSDVMALVRASTLRIWTFSGTVLLLLLAAGVIVTRFADERAMAEERARNSEEMLHMHEQMERSRRLSDLGQMVAQVAHEVRNPLLTISSGIELLRGEAGSNPEAVGLVTNIRDAIRRLDGIVNDVLNFTRPMVLDPVVADVHSVLDSALSGLRDRIARGRVEVAKHYGTLLPIRADTLKLSQLFTNLFMNAIEAMPQEGKLTISTEWVAGTTAGNARVRVRDTGPGIPAGKLSRIFEPFVTTKKRGVGLGLAVARQIVELHGGRIQAANAPEGGAEFVVELPVAPPPGRSAEGGTR